MEGDREELRIIAENWKKKKELNEFYDNELSDEVKFERKYITIPLAVNRTLTDVYRYFVDKKGQKKENRLKEKPNTYNSEEMRNFRAQISEKLAQLQEKDKTDTFQVTLSLCESKETMIEFQYSPKFKNEMFKELNRLKESSFYEEKEGEIWPNVNMIINSYFRAGREILKVTSADDILTLLTTSRRIYSELNFHTSNNANVDDIQMELIIKKWVEYPLNHRIRGYVGVNGELNALSQYYNFIYFPELVNAKKQIQSKIQELFNLHLKSKLPSHLFPLLIDFVVLFPQTHSNNFSSDEIEVYVDDIRSLYEGMESVDYSTDLFDISKDKNLIIEGNKGFEFRILEKEPEKEELQQYISQTSEALIDDLMEEYLTGTIYAPPLAQVPSIFKYCNLL